MHIDKSGRQMATLQVLPENVSGDIFHLDNVRNMPAFDENGMCFQTPGSGMNCAVRQGLQTRGSKSVGSWRSLSGRWVRAD